jgi:hypothetical protein
MCVTYDRRWVRSGRNPGAVPISEEHGTRLISGAAQEA